MRVHCCRQRRAVSPQPARADEQSDGCPGAEAKKIAWSSSCCPMTYRLNGDLCAPIRRSCDQGDS
ncbi:hypothetical protein IG631_01968 [Alternaria alternata]|nr:hypothetical protein IG631_01968 [Alternaria alternata]